MRVSAGRSDAILRSAGTSSRSDTTPWGRGLRAPPMATVTDPLEARLLEPSRNRRDVFGRSERVRRTRNRYRLAGAGSGSGGDDKLVC
jgi:hypothetical protein